jgi:mono/diheme cytochrome c family protein
MKITRRTPESVTTGDKTVMNRTIKQFRSVKNIIASLLIFMFFCVFIAPVQAQDTKVRDMKVFFQNSCARCHGADGSATGEDGKKLKGEDFTDQNWLNETTDEKMIKTIMQGKFFGLAMPKFKDKLTQEEAQLMITEIIRKSVKGKTIEPDKE